MLENNRFWVKCEAFSVSEHPWTLVRLRWTVCIPSYEYAVYAHAGLTTK